MKGRAKTEDPAAYRLEELTVTIVSMVDSPAIGREFLLMKRQEEDNVVAKKDAEHQEDPAEETTEESAEETPEGETPEEPVSKEEEPASKEETPEPEPPPEAPVEHAPEPLTIAAALTFLVEHKSELSRVSQAAVGVLERQKADGEPTTDFETAYRYMAASGDVWSCFDALMEVVWNTLDSDGEDKLAIVQAAVKAFGDKLVEILGGVGVKSTEPVKVKLGDVEVEVADEFQGQVLASMADLAEQFAALKEEREQPTEKRDGEEEAVQSEDAPLTATQVLKMIRDGIAEARRPIYKSIAVEEEDTREPPKRKSRADRPGDTVSPGLAGMKRQ